MNATRLLGLGIGFLAVPLLVGIVPSPALAQDSGHPASKATAQVGQIFYVSPGTDWMTILSNTLKTANQKDLFLGVSLVSSLNTSTLVKSKNGATDTESAEAGVDVRVLIDGKPARPGPVTFAKRRQTLSAKLQGILSGALSMDENGNIIIDPDLVLDEEIELILNTMSANSFNFIQEDLGSGTHKVEVQVRVHASASSSDSSASALVGPGSMTVEEVRLIKNEDLSLD